LPNVFAHSPYCLNIGWNWINNNTEHLWRHVLIKCIVDSETLLVASIFWFTFIINYVSKCTGGFTRFQTLLKTEWVAKFSNMTSDGSDILKVFEASL
jgi:hypothetical protein